MRLQADLRRQNMMAVGNGERAGKRHGTYLLLVRYARFTAGWKGREACQAEAGSNEGRRGFGRDFDRMRVHVLERERCGQ